MSDADLVRELRASAAKALRPDGSDDASELSRLGAALHVAGARAEAVACFRRAAAIDGKRLAGAVVKRGRDSAMLVIGFTGFHGLLGVSRMNFLEAAGLQEAGRVLLWDSSYRFFLDGLPGVAKGYGTLLDFIRARIGQLSPRKVVVVGCSGSGFAALLYGHALGADVVHAFSPAVSLDLPMVERIQPRAAVQYRELMLEIAASGVDRALLHLPAVLARGNGKTRYNVHYGRSNRDDRERAGFIAGLPGVELIEHQTASHLTAELLASANRLKAVFAAESGAEIPRLRS